MDVRSDRDEINTSEGRLVVAIRKRSACQAGLIHCPIHALAAGSASEIILAA